MNELDLAWAAGFLDGEGGFFIYKIRKRDKYDCVRGHLKVNQAVHRDPIDRLHDLFGGSVTERRTRTVTGKRVYEWQMSRSADLQASLPLVLPYMIVKRDQAELLLKLSTYYKNGGRGGSPYREEREDIYRCFQETKARYHQVEQ